MAFDLGEGGWERTLDKVHYQSKREFVEDENRNEDGKYLDYVLQIYFANTFRMFPVVLCEARIYAMK